MSAVTREVRTSCESATTDGSWKRTAMLDTFSGLYVVFNHAFHTVKKSFHDW